jgi:MFS family permease
MCLATFVAILDTSLVNLGLKSIQQGLHADTATLQWVIDLYILTYAVFILTGDTLGDLYGRRRVFLIGVIIFGLGTLVCAVAPSAEILVLGRGISGFGAALELPVALAILNVIYPDERKRASAIAIWGGMNGLAMAIGPTTAVCWSTRSDGAVYSGQSCRWHYSPAAWRSRASPKARTDASAGSIRADSFSSS